ncbi:slipin family protein [Streptomyces spirodelae]|uniref:SPFH domain-containing protein n=1 Tax=Streptomyces spirodelae TaxID=2812904 RepID=A0ABS3WLY4_9ACTN|nr:SPFH domain-containing protein [Streptomyces spirodelae]MBO8184120.1 SPFH domain-containing protein [Streptomyces spirodelae]
MQAAITVIVLVGLLAVMGALSAIRVVKQYERGVVLRLGRLHRDIRGPGLTLIVPVIDRLRKVNMQIVTMPVPAQEGITRDNVTVRVDAVVYFKVVKPADAVIRVENYQFAVSQMAQTSLRSIIGKSDLDDLLSNREKLNQGLELMIDSPAVDWGVQIDRVEIKDVSLPDTMKRSMARQAEAHRERRARVINADAELQASKRLAEAAQQMSVQPAALQLRLLQTITAVAAEKNSTLVLPFPVELLRFLERAQQPEEDAETDAEAGTEPAALGETDREAEEDTRRGSEERLGLRSELGKEEEEIAATFRPAERERRTERARAAEAAAKAEAGARFTGPLPPDPAAPLRDPAMVLPELQVTGLPTAEDLAQERYEPSDESRSEEDSSHRGRGGKRRHHGKAA